MPGMIILIGLLNIGDVDMQFCCYGQDSQSVIAVNDQISHISLSNIELPPGFKRNEVKRNL
ncbi:MAG: hypothetical protein HQ568_03870, partial [Calditrichaeota bacterium]|nr:hypothetical protein [Calditrichota bacterium]